MPAGKAKIQIKNPYDGVLIAEIEATNKKELPAVFTRAIEAFRKNRLQSIDRFEIINKAARLLDQDEDRFSKLICLETGKPIRECRIEVSRAVTTLTWSAQESLRIEGLIQPCDVTFQHLDRKAYIHRVPLGVIAAVTPFNFPLNIPSHKIGPALASGNALILKPSPRSPLATGELVQLFFQAGLPRDLLQVVQGGPEISRDLVEGPVNAVSFTGSSASGQEVGRWAAGKKITMELGGSDPVVVMQDADLDAAAQAITSHRFGSSGQRCTSSKRALIHEAVYDEMKRLLAARVSRLKTGDPRDENTDIGPLIDEETAEQLSQHLASAVKLGAVIVTGGRREGNLFFPTVIEKVPHGHPLVREEILGPVLPLVKFTDFDEAVKLVNSTPYGLQSAIFTNNLDLIKKAFEEFETGALVVNEGTGLRVEPIPFGGVKASGIGREGIRYAMEEFTTLKTLIL